MDKDTHNSTANKILDIAERYTQTRGFNAFSYQDIQKDLGIKTSSIHYYFRTKNELAVQMLERYLKRYQCGLQEINDYPFSPLQKLQAFADMFLDTAKQERFCLCGMLAADIHTLPDTVKKHLQDFFHLNEQWIAEVIRQGIANKNIKNSIKPESAAAHFLATLEGGILITRVRKGSEYLRAIISEALERLTI